MRGLTIPSTADEIKKVAALTFVDFSETPTVVLVAEYEHADDMFHKMDALQNEVILADWSDHLQILIHYIDSIRQAMHTALFERYADFYNLNRAIDAGIVNDYKIQHENKHFDEWIEEHRQCVR